MSDFEDCRDCAWNRLGQNSSHWDSEDFRNILNAWLNPAHTLFIPHQLWQRVQYSRFFNEIEKKPLTKKQQKAIILDEKRNLVVAGAGTGKTSTVVGKVGYLLKSGKARPSEVLVIAYNNAAAKELAERISERIQEDVPIGTFHSIGRQILGAAQYSRRISPFVEQDEAYRDFLQNCLEGCLRDKEARSLFAAYFLKHEYAPKDEHKDFTTFAQYSSWVRRNHLLTLNKEGVKSYGELLIANFLCFKGIQYDYEPTYRPRNEKTLDFIYKPDFHIPSIDAYIEYFGIDEQGNTAPYMDAKKYCEQMQRKIGTHRRGGTDLIQLFYHQNRDGRLLSTLHHELSLRGAVYKTISIGEILQKFNETGENQTFLDLVDQVLTQLKENANNISIERLLTKPGLDERSKTFLGILGKIYSSYQNQLKAAGHIDFGDMIATASDMVREGRFSSPWKYIIIDEFQDISQGRFDLIQSLLAQNKKTKLFCVGDDWQAIYRFAGSDHQIMNRFRSLVGGKSTRLKLDTTFRFNDRIADVSQQFITRNPSQIRKKLQTLTHRKEPQVYLHWTGQDLIGAIKEVAAEIAENQITDARSLQVLSRYNRNKIGRDAVKELGNIWRGDISEPMTVHAAKGLEADYVIVADLNSEKSGFPSERGNDPVLNLVLSKRDRFEHSEERRLFYVAMTRAREQTHLIANSLEQSAFARELAAGDYDIVVTGAPGNKFPCPECKDGKIVEKKLPGQSLFGCSNYPLCEYMAPGCSSCDRSFVERKKDEDGRVFAQCLNDDCSQRYEACSRCPGGILIRRSGPRGDFLGCHTYGRTGCRATKELAESHCPGCKDGIVERKKDEDGRVFAQCRNCRREYEACDRCADGIILLKKSGPGGDFLGCHNFAKTGCKGTGELNREQRGQAQERG